MGSASHSCHMATLVAFPDHLGWKGTFPTSTFLHMFSNGTICLFLCLFSAPSKNQAS